MLGTCFRWAKRHIYIVLSLVFFFFQAEDGIRDVAVTGVQTCALPIFMLLKRVHRGETLGYGCTFEVSREMIVATLPIGYNDGYVRALSNRGRAIVRDRKSVV